MQEPLEDALNRIWLAISSLAFLMAITEATLFALLLKIDGKDKTNGLLPPIFVDGKKTFNSVVNVLKRYRFLGGTKPTTSKISPELERSFYRYIRDTAGKVDLKLSENHLYPLWKSWGGTSKGQMRDMLDRAESDGILTRKNKDVDNSTRVLAPGKYGEVRRRSEGILKPDKTITKSIIVGGTNEAEQQATQA